MKCGEVRLFYYALGVLMVARLPVRQVFTVKNKALKCFVSVLAGPSGTLPAQAIVV